MKEADVWVIDAGSTADTEQITSLLNGFNVLVVSTNELGTIGDCELRPAVLIAVIDSWRIAAQREMDAIARYAGELPLIVIDRSFNAAMAPQLAAGGVQDYLGTLGLDAERLTACISFAVVRHGHQTVRRLRPLFEARPDLDVPALRAIARVLPPSEREIFQLLITCLSNAELASRLGKSRQTILNQISSLKQRFGVASREDLIVISIVCLPE